MRSGKPRGPSRTRPPSLIFKTSVRARQPLRRSRRATASEWARIARSSTARSDTSRSNVFSSLIETGSRHGATSRTSSPRPSRATSRPHSPRCRSTYGRSARTRSPIVAKPACTSRASATGPTPHKRPIGSGSRNARTSPARTSRRPSGFATSLAIFATIFTGAMPTETASSVSRRISARRRSPTSAGGPSRRSLPVRSRNASSSERPSTRGEKRSKIAKIRFDSAAYFAIEPATKIACGQRRRACALGIAEWMPNSRAS